MVSSRQRKARRIFTALRTLNPLCFDDFTAAQAGCADAHMLGRCSHPGMNRAQVDVPAPLAHIVGVTDGIAELRPFAADFTDSCHNSVFLPGLLPKH
jgi:hypothetical protein